MGNIIAIHGSFGSPYENWLPWLSSACTARGSTFFAPSFPSPTGQTFENWASILDGYRNAGLLDETAIVIAHSSGASFFLKYATRRHVRIEKFISVAGFTGFIGGDPDFDKINREFYLDDGETRDLSGVRNKISFLSESDPFLPFDVLMRFSDMIEAKCIKIPEGGHFNTSSGFNEFPELLAEI